jgi:membrane protein insertase Oxa1/YidC/SpoIIIJ
VYFLTAKLNRKFMYQPATTEGQDARQVACSNTMMDVTMPAMSAFFTFMVPALVGVYWMFRSVVGLAKQFILSRLMPLPTFTEEDYKAAAREMAGKRVVKKSDNVGKVRSLHHIDDEDYDDTRERALARKAAIEERERQEREEKAKKTPFGTPALKKDRQKDSKDDATQKQESPKDENAGHSDDTEKE